MNAALAIFFAFLNTNTSFKRIKTKATINPTIEMTKNTICGIKFESVIEVVNGRAIYFGM